MRRKRGPTDRRKRKKEAGKSLKRKEHSKTEACGGTREKAKKGELGFLHQSLAGGGGVDTTIRNIKKQKKNAAD